MLYDTFIIFSSILLYTLMFGPVVSNHGSLGPCSRPWRGVVTDRRTTTICQFMSRREWPTSMA